MAELKYVIRVNARKSFAAKAKGGSKLEKWLLRRLYLFLINRSWALRLRLRILPHALTEEEHAALSSNCHHANALFSRLPRLPGASRQFHASLGRDFDPKLPVHYDGRDFFQLQPGDTCDATRRPIIKTWLPHGNSLHIDPDTGELWIFAVPGQRENDNA